MAVLFAFIDFSRTGDANNGRNDAILSIFDAL